MNQKNILLFLVFVIAAICIVRAEANRGLVHAGPGSGWVVLDSSRSFTLNFRKGKSGYYYMRWTLTQLGNRCQVWDPEGHMEKPEILSNTTKQMDLNDEKYKDIRVLEFRALPGESPTLQFQVYE